MELRCAHTLVPVLPSDQDVVESQMFYFAPGQEHFSIDSDGNLKGQCDYAARAGLNYRGNSGFGQHRIVGRIRI